MICRRISQSQALTQNHTFLAHWFSVNVLHIISQMLASCWNLSILYKVTDLKNPAHTRRIQINVLNFIYLYKTYRSSRKQVILLCGFVRFAIILCGVSTEFCECQFDCMCVFAVSVFVRSQIWTQVSTHRVEANLDLKRSWSTLHNILFLPNIHFLSHHIAKTNFYCFHSLFFLFVISQVSIGTFSDDKILSHETQPETSTKMSEAWIEKSICVFFCSAGCLFSHTH